LQLRKGNYSLNRVATKKSKNTNLTEILLLHDKIVRLRGILAAFINLASAYAFPGAHLSQLGSQNHTHTHPHRGRHQTSSQRRRGTGIGTDNDDGG